MTTNCENIKRKQNLIFALQINEKEIQKYISLLLENSVIRTLYMNYFVIHHTTTPCANEPQNHRKWANTQWQIINHIFRYDKTV